jgi:hypothetical protein
MGLARSTAHHGALSPGVSRLAITIGAAAVSLVGGISGFGSGDGMLRLPVLSRLRATGGAGDAIFMLVLASPGRFLRVAWKSPSNA